MRLLLDEKRKHMFLLIDKPKGLTSHDVIYQIRKITGEKRVGHGGTLDPNATGLLVVAVGRNYTKQLGIVLKGLYKTYEAEIILGEDRDTYDVEGKLVKKYKVAKAPTIEKVNQVLEMFLGAQEQTPPIFSAVKIGGVSAHRIARKGGTPKIDSKTIVIKDIELVSYSYPKLELRMTVSPGTYIRTFAHDLGATLKTGAYLNNLRRTKIGKLSLSVAAKLSEITPLNWKKLGKTDITV